ncbi:divalent cation tolerance protein CutA [candidate division KSB1 bacterium]|nr:divalent cation tolerance protein CutA [candidate division KSB1 bacterium]
MENFLLVFVTFADKPQAEKCIEVLLGARLIACANIVSEVHSRFHWQGSISNEAEILVIMKTRQKLIDELIKTVKENHSYQVPEIIALPIVAGAYDYMEWIKEETSR